MVQRMQLLASSIIVLRWNSFFNNIICILTLKITGLQRFR